MSELEKQPVQWSFFKETVMFAVYMMGILWVVASSCLMATVVLNAIFH